MRLQCKEKFFFFYVFFSAQRENKKNLFYRESKNQGSCFAENKEKSCTRPQRIFFGERRRIKFKFVNKVFQAFHRLPFKKKIFSLQLFCKKNFSEDIFKEKNFCADGKMQGGREVILKKNFNGYFQRENAQTVRCRASFAEKKDFCRKSFCREKKDFCFAESHFATEIYGNRRRFWHEKEFFEA